MVDTTRLFPIQEQAESGGNPLAVSPKGALGPMQTMPTTLTSPGYGVRPAANNTPDEQRRVGQDYMNAMIGEYGNLPDALAAYNWGPGNFNKWRDGGRDSAKMPKETRDYISKITTQYGEPVEAGAGRGVVNPPAVPTGPVLLRDTRAEREAMFDASFRSMLVKPTNPEAYMATITQGQANMTAQVEARPSFLEMAGGAIAGNTGNSIFKAIFRDKFEPVEGFKADPNLLPKGWDSELYEQYQDAKSPAEAKYAISQWEDEQLRIRTVMDRGVGTGMLLALGGEGVDPVNWVVPFAAMKGLARVGMGSEVLFKAGATRAGYASSIGENLVSGTVLEAVKQSLQGEFKPVDLAISLLADSLIGVGTGALSARHAASSLASKAGATALARESDLATRAEQRLGKLATPAEVRAEMEVVRKEDANSYIKAAVADVPNQHKLVDGEVAPTPEPVVPGTLTGPRDNTPTVPKERVVIATAPVKESLEQALTSPALLNEASPDSRGARQLISHLLDILPESVLAKDVNFTGYGSRGSFNWMTGELDSPGRAAADLMPKGVRPNEAVILAHEVVHAATAKMIDAVEVGAAGVTKDMHKAVSNLAAMRRDLETELTKLGKLDKSSEFGANYATKNLHEFVAQVMSDADTRTVLASMPAKGFVDRLAEFANAVMRLLGFNPKAGNTALQEAITLIEKVIKEGPPPDAPRATVTRTGLSGPQPAEVVNELMQDPDFVKFGLTGLQVATASQRKEAQAILAIHKKAAAWEVANPMDDAWKARAKNLSDNSVFNVASTGLKMLTSPSPVVRMIANQLLEDASGVAGKRKDTASIKKYMVERMMKGNAENDVQGAYAFWKKDKPGGNLDDLVGGKRWAAFNKEIAAEIEARRVTGTPVTSDLNVKVATDSLEAAYQRIANEQRRVNTLGSEGLPTTSVGYMPHRMNAKMFITLPNEHQQVVHSALTDQFVGVGWDMSFSDQLATKYLDLARSRASGDYGSAIGGSGAASHVEEALRAMQLPEKTITQHMEKFQKGAANFTKKRLELDLNKEYTVNGEPFKLLDIFETDQIELLRSQAGRASGDVALTAYGVRGKPGTDLLRKAMQYGEDGKRADLVRDFESFDQVMAEFMNAPYGTAAGKWLDRAMQANTLVRLGGIVFNQFAEAINGIASLGFIRAAETVTSIPRLRAEIHALARGEKVDNGLLSSIEITGGAEFGTDAYKFVMPFDSPNHAYPTYGKDTLTLTDRLLRGGGHLQAKLSGWRTIHSAQQRGMAEQIVHKMARYVREGKDDIALDQFGITAEVRTALRGELNKIATFDGDRLVRFDVTKISDPAIREQVIQAVWRGTSQIIQGTFIGETGKWAHDGMLKLMTQFRTFQITSMEKQWGRQRNSHGAFKASAMLAGAMTFAVPVYMARTYLSSIGRDDQAKFLEERLQPQMIARATLNYVASGGMTGDFIDAITSTMPEDWGIKSTGGRSGVETDFVGNYIAPASSLVNDIWKYAQSPLEVDDALKVMPGSRLPFLVPLINLTKD